MPDGPPMTDERGTVLRRARREDARAVAELIAVAGEGIPTLLWSQQAAPCHPHDTEVLLLVRDVG